jgi:hypothetical protein
MSRPFRGVNVDVMAITVIGSRAFISALKALVPRAPTSRLRILTLGVRKVLDISGARPGRPDR